MKMKQIISIEQGIFDIYTCILLSLINNTDMIKISRVMTVYTIRMYYVYVYNSVSCVYNRII
jgi:hypothetical protein